MDECKSQLGYESCYFFKNYPFIYRLSNNNPPTLYLNQVEHEWGGGLIVCTIIPIFIALAFRFLIMQICPFSMYCLQSIFFMIKCYFDLNWRVGRFLASLIASLFSLILSPPFDLMAMNCTILLLALRESSRYLKNQAFLAKLQLQMHRTWKERARYTLKLRRFWRRYSVRSRLWNGIW